jgi:hypothetical protein
MLRIIEIDLYKAWLLAVSLRRPSCDRLCETEGYDKTFLTKKYAYFNNLKHYQGF